MLLSTYALKYECAIITLSFLWNGMRAKTKNSFLNCRHTDMSHGNLIHLSPPGTGAQPATHCWENLPPAFCQHFARQTAQSVSSLTEELILHSASIQWGKNPLFQLSPRTDDLWWSVQNEFLFWFIHSHWAVSLLGGTKDGNAVNILVSVPQSASVSNRGGLSPSFTNPESHEFSAKG